jgi:NTP pyrophosphatase (non-canonical NTP hydrolase)
MDLNEYQAKALTTDAYQKTGSDMVATELAFLNKVLGLVGESGEVAEKVKKIIRNNDGKMSDVEKEEILKELGDVLWYLATLSSYLGSSLEYVAKSNLDKLASRQKRGVLKSKGDNR